MCMPILEKEVAALKLLRRAHRTDSRHGFLVDVSGLLELSKPQL